MSEHAWLRGKEFIDAHDSGNHVIRVVGGSMAKDYVVVMRADQVSEGWRARRWERNVHVITPMILLHELNQAARPMIIDMMDRNEHVDDLDEPLQDVEDVIQALNNVKSWQECGAWKRS